MEDIFIRDEEIKVEKGNKVKNDVKETSKI